MNGLDVVMEDGRAFARISSVLHCFRFPDDYESADVGRKAEGARVGTQIHARIQKLAMGKKVVPPTGFEAKTAWENFIEWKELTGFELRGKLIEQRYFDRTLGITGCIDCLGSEGVVDWKTSNRLLTRHWLQVNAYVGLAWPVEEREGKEVRLVRFDKSNRVFEDVSQTFDKDLWNWFVNLVSLAARMYTEQHHVITGG